LVIDGGGSSSIIRAIDAADTSNLLFAAGILTTILFLSSFVIFVILAIKSNTIKSFQSQISIFIGVYVVGEVLELNSVQNITRLPSDLGSQIHAAATIIITVVLWSRLYYSGKIIKKLADPDQSGNQTD
jgi:hypothetical protein